MEELPVLRDMWCHICKREFKLADKHSLECDHCHNTFCEEIDLSEDPRSFIPFGEELHRIDQQQAQQQHSSQQQQNQIGSNQMSSQQFTSNLSELNSLLQNRNRGVGRQNMININNNQTENPISSGQQLNSIGQYHNHSDRSNVSRTRNNPLSFQISFQSSLLPANENNVSSSINGILSSLFPNTASRMGQNGLMGDGNSFENILDFIMRNDPNVYGTPPAGENSIKNLPKIKFSKDSVKEENLRECSVCKEEFEEATEVVKMPCNHLFHQECLLTWLKMHNSCPTCRFELPTDNEDYERRKQDQQRNNSQQQQHRRN